MEPVTHFLTGACLARAGFNRTTAYATLAMTLAAEGPDIDVFWGVAGPVAQFQHHRGITHTFIGAPVVAAIVVAIVYGIHRMRRKTLIRTHGMDLPPRWGLLWLLSLVAALSHILLDFLNNYGVRPLFPFHPQWYAANIVFIFEPIIFALLLLALIVPAILSLADREIGGRRQPFAGRGWSLFALLAITAYCGWRVAEQHHARQLLSARTWQGEDITRIGFGPYPINPFRWHAVVETPDLYQLATVDTRTDSIDTDDRDDVFYKPAETPATLAAKSSWLGRVYLDWSKFPVVEQQVKPADSSSPDTTVQFRDLRFAYSTLFLSSRQTNALGGTVLVGPRQSIKEMRLGTHIQH